MKQSLRWVVVADDLSGAADAGAGFLGAGQRVVVAWGPVGAFDSLPGANVLAIDAESRRGTAERARSVTFAAVEAARTRGAARLFTKIDSTLRGHVGEQVAAALDAWGEQTLAIVAPAFPAVGRTTVDGRQLVNGSPISAPPIAHVLETSGLRASRLSLAEVRGAELQDVMLARLRAGDRALVCDAETPADLTAIARAGSSFETPVAWVGSGGLARQLGTAGLGSAADDSSEPQGSGFTEPIARGPVLIVVGSATDVARRQAAAVASRGAIHVAVPASDLAADPAEVSLDEPLHRILLHLEAARDVIVTIERGDDGGDDDRLVARLAGMLKPAARSVGGLVVTGGETAMHLFHAWGVAGLRLFDEIDPGMPRSWTLGRIGVPVVTKSGAFGDDLSLERARRRLRAEEPAVHREGDAAWRSR